MSTRQERTAAAFGCAVIGALALAASAPAATTVGQAVTPEENASCFRGVYMQTGTTPSSRSYSIPAAGVITSWHTDPGRASSAVRLKVFRPGADPRFVAESDIEHSTFTDSIHDARIPVRKNDRIVYEATNERGSGCLGKSVAEDDTTGTDLGFHPIPSKFDLGITKEFSRVNIEAVVEPDADGDGFGDDSQDRCPTDAERREPCLVPPAPVQPDPPVVPAPQQPSAPAPPAPVAPVAPVAPPVTAPGDVIGPLVRASAKKRQRLTARRGLVITVTADEAAALTASVRGVKLRGARATTPPGKRIRLELKASRAAIKRLKRRPELATVTLSARDSAGNQTTKRLRVRLTS